MGRAQEILLDGLVQEGEQMLEITCGIQQSQGFAMDAQLGPGNRFE